MYTILKHCDVLLEIHTVFAYMKVYVSDGEHSIYTVLRTNERTLKVEINPLPLSLT